jgi:DNA-binding XRE family transcriptional regulator
MATQECTTKRAGSAPQTSARNQRLCGIMGEHGARKGYLFMAPGRLSVPIVSAALGALLAEQRKSLKLTRAEAAQRADVSCTQLSTLERGLRQPTICEFLSLGEALGMDPRELFSRMLSKLHYPVGYRPVRTV